jgi:hypothetical protein
MMFDNKNGGGYTGGFKHAHPLAAVKICRIKKILALITIAPLTVGKSIHIKMDKRLLFPMIPFDLAGIRCEAVWRGRRGLSMNSERRKGPQ